MKAARMLVLAGAGVLLMAGCSSSESDSGSEQGATPAPTSATGAADGGCSVATVDGTTANAAMQAVATQVYESLQCGGEQTLDEQLIAAGESNSVKTTAEAAGLTVSVNSAAGGTVMQLAQVEDRSACTITVIDNLEAKTLSCADL